MKKASIIKNNKVINRIVLPDDWKNKKGYWQPSNGEEVIFDDNAKMNYEKIDGEWIDPDKEELNKEE